VLQEVALVESQEIVVESPRFMLDGFALRSTVGVVLPPHDPLTVTVTEAVATTPVELVPVIVKVVV
jgi:hypothetical protein